ncbi:hypothetical protein KAF25_001422 [Fusarium avenaceum]|uniref:Uncharacterized protein n=1 Tax=Fusarium avenaceum TaxID=40199 RepID=A0A9P7H6I4_9HYPO|nr:hypothetical protein KAF25_001422 [Fusarium avenaceum]
MPQEIAQAETAGQKKCKVQCKDVPSVMLQRWMEEPRRVEAWSSVHTTTQNPRIGEDIGKNPSKF